MLLRSKIDFLQFEFTFVRLRYSLGGDRPSQTTYYKLFLHLMSNKKFLVWYFNYVLVNNLCYDIFINFPRILHKKVFFTIYNYSKGAQGLSV